jgi:hypothetical protein
VSQTVAGPSGHGLTSPRPPAGKAPRPDTLTSIRYAVRDSQMPKGRHIRSMRSPKKKPIKLRSWAATILRQRGHLLGYVEAPDERAAEAAAIAQFDLDESESKRLVVRERD